MFSGSDLRTQGSDDIESGVRDLLRGQAWLSAPSQGWVSLYDAYLDRPDLEEMHRVSKAASKRIEAPVFALYVRPGDVLVYILYDAGRPIDGCVSPLDALQLTDAERAAYAGRADILIQYARPETSREALEAVLHGGAPPGTGLTAEHLEAMRQRLQSKVPTSLGDPATVQRMLQLAADQIRMVPPPMIESFLRSMGLPAGHPALAQLRADPAEFIRRMAADSGTIEKFTSQITQGFDGGLAGARPSPQDQAVALATVLGLDPGRVMLDFRAIDGVGAPDGFRFIHR